MGTNSLQFDVAPRNGAARRLVVVRVEGEEIYRDEVNTNSAKDREKFAEALARITGASAEALDARCHAELPRLADAADAAAEEEQTQERETATSITPPWPDLWPSAVSLGEVFEETLVGIRQHVVLSSEAAVAVSLWVAWSYAVNRADDGPAGDISPLLTICTF
jgi:hypothetical protein